METTSPPQAPVKITVATVTYNAAALIERTLESVERQTYPHVEHLIIDGNSHDGTLTAFMHYQERNARGASSHEVAAVSENDRGIYDAMNKALAMATGDYIVFLNAGDTFHSPDVLARIAACAADDVGVICGDTDIVDSAGRFLRHRRLAPPRRLTSRSFLQGMLVCHQAFFARMSVARSVNYDLRYRFSSDYDWCIRVMRRAERRSMRLLNAGIVVADFLDGGTTTRNHRRSLWERFCVMARRYGLARALAAHAWFVVRAVIRK